MLPVAVRARLAVFSVLSLVVLAVVSIVYVRLPQQLGIGRYTVTADFADASGLYANAIVTYRGADVGKVTALTLRRGGVTVSMSIDDGAHIPLDATASIHSTSAIGEQYVDFVPRPGAGRPTLHDGSRVPRSATVDLPSTDSLIDDLNRLLTSVPPGALTRTLDDVTAALNGSGPDLQRLLTSTGELLDAARAGFGPTRELLQDLAPFLQTQRDLGPRTLATVDDLDSFSHQLVLSNTDVVGLLHGMAPLSVQLAGLERDLTPTLHVLLANLTSVTQVIDVYLPGLRQTLTVYPALVATLIGFAQPTAAQGSIPLYFHLNADDPGICTNGFLPVADRRDPSVTAPISTPTGLYCREAASSPHSVRGTRNTPCLNDPGVRAGTPAACLGLPEPTGNAVGAYDPRTGRVGLPDGSAVTVADVAPGGQAPARTWQQYLLRTAGR